MSRFINSKDVEGRFCGQSVETGEMVGDRGYCGPNCAHCETYRYYVPQGGVYRCAADFNYEKSYDV